MSTIGGKVREQKELKKKVGLFEGNVIAVNPDAEEYKEILNISLPEDSTSTNYLFKDDDGIDNLIVDFWLEDVKTKDRFKLRFYLKNTPRSNKDGSKKQYINSIGVCSWADDPNNLPEWFAKRDYRVAYTGEEELYNFLRSWLGKLDYREAETTLQLDWKTLMKGNVKDIRSQIDGEFSTTVGCLATIRSKDVDGEVKSYQMIYNKAFFPAYTLKNFRLIDYADPNVIDSLKKKTSMYPHERFVVNVTDSQYGCKDHYILKDIKEYDPSEDILSTNAPVQSSEDGPDL